MSSSPRARQLGHDARLMLERYGHSIDELDGHAHQDAAVAISTGRSF